MLEASLLQPEKTRPLKRVEYDRLVALGAFEDERVELIRGTLVAMSPRDPEHTSPISQLTMLLVPLVAGRAIVRIQSPIVATDESEPEPDVAIVPVGSYKAAHPDRAHLIIEVAFSSAKKDRLIKAPLYAESGFPEYWLVDVPGKFIEVHRDPATGGEGYRRVTRHGAGETLTVAAFPDVRVSVDDVFA